MKIGLPSFGGNARNARTTHSQREARQASALERQEEYDKLSLQERLDRALVRGHENSREAMRLREAIEKAA